MKTYGAEAHIMPQETMPISESEDSYFGDFIEDDEVDSPITSALTLAHCSLFPQPDNRINWTTTAAATAGTTCTFG